MKRVIENRSDRAELFFQNRVCFPPFHANISSDNVRYAKDISETIDYLLIIEIIEREDFLVDRVKYRA